MDTGSLAYTGGRYHEIFKAARTGDLKEEEKIAYSASLEKLRETKAGILYAAEKARNEGRAEGQAEGRAEGRAEAREEAMKIMFSCGISREVIADKYGLTPEEVNRFIHN